MSPTISLLPLIVPSIWQLLVVLVLVLVLFGGRGKITSVMGDLAKGITSFRKGLRDEDPPKPAPRAITDGGETLDVAAERKQQSAPTE